MQVVPLINPLINHLIIFYTNSKLVKEYIEKISIALTVTALSGSAFAKGSGGVSLTHLTITAGDAGIAPGILAIVTSIAINSITSLV